MRIALWIDELRPFPEVVAEVERAAEAGYPRVWVGERTGWDPLTLIGALGSRVPEIGFGTAVVTTHPRHPLALAAQALTVQAATGGRLSLGIGPSHQPIVEGRFGGRWDRPLLRVREYLDVLLPALRGEQVDVHGETVGAAGAIDAPGAAAPPVLLAAHGPRMLALAGERADGVLTTWVRPEAVAAHVVPAVGSAPVVAGVVLSLSRDVDAARAFVAEAFAPATGLPSYRRSFERDGLSGPADTVVAGDEETLAAAVRAYADAGVAELQVCPLGPPDDRARTVAFLGELSAAVA